MEEFGDPRKALGGPGTVTLFLALYLLVLAFFILLNSMAAYEEVKSKAVLESLSTTFASQGAATGDDPFLAAAGESAAAREFQAQVGRLVQAAIPAARVELLRPGRLMQVEFPADMLFLPDSAALRPGQVPLLDRLVAAMSVPPPGLRYELDFTIGAGPAPQLARAGAFARGMAERGAAPRGVLVGIDSGDPRRATLLFRTVAEDDGRLSFGAPRQ